MRSTRILNIVLTGAMLLPMSALAQTGTTGGDSGQGTTEHRGEGFAQKLNLRPEQQTQLKQLRETQKQQAEAIRNDTSLTPEQKREKMKELHKSSREQFLAQLTPEQREQVKQMRPHRGHGHRGPKNGGEQSQS